MRLAAAGEFASGAGDAFACHERAGCVLEWRVAGDVGGWQAELQALVELERAPVRLRERVEIFADAPVRRGEHLADPWAAAGLDVDAGEPDGVGASGHL